MLPHSFTKEVIGTDRPSYTMQSSGLEENENGTSKGFDFFNNEHEIILEDEEEYDVLNSETFGGSIADIQNNDDVPWEENYDLHNDVTFGGEEDMEYDWEKEHEKLVEILENKSGDSKNELESPFGEISHDASFILSPDVIKRNGYKIDNLKVSADLIPSSKSLKESEKPFQFPPTPVHKSDLLNSHFKTRLEYRYNDTLDQVEDSDPDFGSTETLTNENSSKSSKHDKWYNSFENTCRSSELDSLNYSRGYSLFSPGANLLQTAGIHIPSVSSSSAIPTATETLDKKLESMKLQPQPSISSIPSVADLEKQWITDASSKTIINNDCFRAYNSAFFVNDVPNTSVNNMLHTLPQTPPKVQCNNVNVDNEETFPNYMTTPPPAPPKKIMNSMSENQSHPIGGLASGINGDSDLAAAQRRAYETTFNPEYPPPQTRIFYKNYPDITPNMLNSYSAMGIPIDSVKSLPILNLNKEPRMMVVSEATSVPAPAHLIDSNAMLLNSGGGGSGVGSRANQNIPGLLGSNDARLIFPPPGLTMDPSKMCHVQPVPSVVASATQQQPSSYLTLPPPQVLNGIATVEQQKQLMKMQKESSMANLSNLDEYACMMTEREKYWLAGVQLLQINSMDPFKDDYYFTNYQARRKGNRNKNQNTNNSAWKNAHTKDYSPLQFENSLGRVQVGSVVAPRQVIDTYLLENSPKHNEKGGDGAQDDPIANTSSRKRKALMLHIENMYSKIMSLESLQMNSTKNKADPAAVKLEFTQIATGLQEEILNLKDDFKIIMSIKKGKRLILRFLSFCDNPGEVWFEIFKILDRIVRGDQEHCVLLSYLPYFRAWLTSAELGTLVRIAEYFNKNLNFYMQDKFSVSVIANMIEQAELIYYFSKLEEQTAWMDFVTSLAERAHTSVENIQKPVVSVRPQILRSHLIKCRPEANACKKGVIMKLESALFQSIFTPQLKKLAEVFERNGYEIRICGGAVRDMLTEIKPHDVDFATNATPEQMKDMFSKSKIRMLNTKGEKHGTITARIYDKENFEITTLRKDIATDGRHAEVEFTTDWETDAARRDLTVNSMFLGLDGSLYDYFNGYQDLLNKRVLFVGEPGKRIEEDYLRILRYFRFFGRIVDNPNSYDEGTLQAITLHMTGLDKISGERIWTELKKILTGNYAEEIMKTMFELGLSKHIGLGSLSDLNVKSFEQMCHLRNKYDFKPISYIGMLLQNESQVAEFDARMKLSRAERDLLRFVVFYKDKVYEEPSENPLRPYQDLLVRKEVENKDHVLEYLMFKDKEDFKNQLASWKMPRLPISGNILMERSVKNQQIGHVLREMTKLWVNSDFHLTQKELLDKLPDISASTKKIKLVN